MQPRVLPMAGLGIRTVAFAIDAIVANLIAGLAQVGGWDPGYQRGWVVLGAFLLIELVFVRALGRTPGMAITGVLVVRQDGSGLPSLGWTAARTVLLALILPAVIIDGDGRALHDRACGTVMLRHR
jgi:uncharacterized RDD family membrane protein YckC